MRNGLRCGIHELRADLLGSRWPRTRNARHRVRWGIDMFLEDGAYTTVASAVAMLMVLALLFSASLAVWSAGRSGDVQARADATALAGANVVSSYHTVATVLDACSLSLGLAGFAMTGRGVDWGVRAGRTGCCGKDAGRRPRYARDQEHLRDIGFAGP